MAPAVLTVAGRGPETYGSDCPEHPEWSRHGLTRQHALNVVAKHNREDHALVEVNLSALAEHLLMKDRQELWDAWDILTGKTGGAAVELAGELTGQGVTATVAPF